MTLDNSPNDAGKISIIKLDADSLMIVAQLIGKALNSRLNLAILFFLYTVWGIGPKLDEIRVNTAALRQIETMTIQNSEHIAMLVERCGSHPAKP